MGGVQASKTLLSIQLKNRGEGIGEEERSAILADIQKKYDDAMNPRYAASRLWVDELIEPADTRKMVSRALLCAANNPELPAFRTGVLQT